MHPRTFAALLALTWACGSSPEDNDNDGFADGVFEPNNVSVITPVKPTGWISGSVFDATTGLPLAGATVGVLGAGVAVEVSADAAGNFQAGPLPAASYAVRISAGGHADALISQAIIPSAAGNFPIEDASLSLGSIGLLPTTGGFAIQLVSESGEPVSGARVSAETAVRWLLDGAARGTQVVTAESDANGRVELEGLVDLWLLPPRLETLASLSVTVAPVDLDGDGVAELRGQTVVLSGAEVRSTARPPVILLRSSGAAALTVLASNVHRLVAPAVTEPSVLDPSGPIRIVFSLPIDRDAILVDLRDDLGQPAPAVMPVVGVLENTLELVPSQPLMPGQEYNLSLRVRSTKTVPVQSLTVAAPFFVKSDPNQALQSMVSFLDVNRDGGWGTAGDVLQIRFSRAIGRAGRSPAFQLQVHLGLDLNSSGVVGDGQGEFVPGMPPTQPPLIVAAAEPAPGNGAPLSGFTRVVADLGISLVAPLPNIGGPVPYEIRISPATNDGIAVTDPEGRPVVERFTGDAPLLTP